ncbi:MAG: hypothetical protein A3K13_14290, partial [Gemmatimonadetes bacterium RIFCSPLOWO2_12_FULL_68_9]
MAVRGLRTTPWTAAAAVLTLALGTGLTTAVYAVAYGVLFRPLPYARPDRLALVGSGRSLSVRKPDIDNWVARLRTVEDVAAYTRSERFTVRGAGEPRVVDIAIVSDRFFQVLGLAMERGRPIAPGGPVTDVVVSDRLCRDLEAAGQVVLGQALTIGDRTFVVVGVAPPSLGLPNEDVDIWLRLDAVPDVAAFGRPDVRGYQLVARLRDDATLATLTDDARRVEADLAQWRGGRRPPELPPVSALPVGEELTAPLRPVLGAFAVAAILVLAVACANVAVLLVARTLARRRDLAVRLALGAGRWRLVRGALAESAAIAVAGAVLGTVLAVGAVRVVTRLAAGELPRLDAVRVDVPVLAAGVLVAIVAALVAGLAPALHATRADAAALLGRAGASTRQGRRLRAALVALQTALSIVLVIGAGLLARTVSRLLSTDAGFEPRGALTVRLQLVDATRFDAVGRAPFVRDLLERVRALPAVRSAGVGGALPPEAGFVFMSVALEDEAGHRETIMMDFAPVTGGYLAAIGAHLLSGRDFTEADAAASPPVTVISASVVPFFFKDRDPIGQDLPFALPGTKEKPRVIGIANDVKYSGLNKPLGTTMWVPWQRLPSSVVFLVVRAAGDPAALAPDVRSIIRNLDPAQPIATMRSLEDVVSASVAGPRFRARLGISFAALALLVAIVGLAGVVARSVVERRRELAIRLALGASPARVLHAALSEAVGVTLAGVALGLGGAALAGRAL